MGIYIPNMEKPKSCWECPFYDPEYTWTCDLFDAYCPLIEIVQCKDCKWWDNNDDSNRCTHESGGMWAKPNAFCSYGERRE